MSDFIRFVLYELNSIMVLLLLAGILAAVVIAVAHFVFKKKHKGKKQFPWRKLILSLLLVGYLFIVISATILRKTGSFRREYNLHLFRAWLEAWNNFSVTNWANILLNVALFAPLGVLLPLLWKKCRRWYVTIPIGFSTSLAIELVQLAIPRGICDVDDLFANTLGTVIGFFCIMAALALFNEKGRKLKPCLLNAGIALIPILTICSIFISYHLKEYGNLPDAPAYTNNTSGVFWSLDCQLPSSEGTVSSYRTQSLNTSQCDTFAKALAENLGLTVDMASYYQNFAYYNLRPGGILSVYYYDGSYNFKSSAHWDETKWIEADRETIMNALSDFPVDIPTQAEFSYMGDGWHSFSIHHHIDGALMYDGNLLARYADNGKVEEVENRLCTYSYYEEVEIISPEEAFEHLKAGRFNDGGYFESAQPSTISVTGCVLDYQVDTKGFYQPVYIFNLDAPNTYRYTIMIPAMQ